MYRISRLVKITTNAVVPSSTSFNSGASSIVSRTSNYLRLQPTTALAARFYSKDGKDCSKGPNDETASKKVNLRECKPLDINPCKRVAPVDQTKYPPLDDCPKPNLMSDCPQPECPWEEEHKKKSTGFRNILLLGLLFAAASLGALYFLGFLEKEEKSSGEKKVSKKKKRAIIKDPKSSSEIPNKIPYLLIGGGTASFSAFRAIKSIDPTAKVLVLTNESFYPYMRPPLSKEMWFNEDKESVKKLIFKQWNGSERNLAYEPDDFYTKCKDLMSSPNGGVSVARGYNVAYLDVLEKIAYLDDGYEINYNKCLIAAGATPKTLKVFEVATASDPIIEEKVKLFRNIYDFEDVNETFDESKSIAVVGGGFLGSELACALARKGKKDQKKIHQIFRENGNMGKILPEYLSFWTTDKIKSEGVDVITNAEIVGVKSDDKQILLTLNNGKTLKVDQVVLAVGVEPNTTLAEKSNLEVDPDLGGYLVNTELLARSDLYIAGDCACFYDAKLGRRRIEHHDHAVVTGRLAGENMTGSVKPYLHQSMFWSDLGPDVGYEAIGIVDSSLPTVGVFAKATSEDSPKAVVTATDEGLRSESEEVPKECAKFLSPEEAKKLEEQEAEKRKELSKARPENKEDYGKGVIFYLRDDVVVGIVLWNVFNRMSIARQVLKDESKYDDLNEVAKLFNIHEE